MPEMIFRVRWPDETVSACYSPSLIVKEYFTAGEAYPLADFVRMSHEALTIASERVRAKYGFYCTAAVDQLARIDDAAARFAAVGDARVVVEGFD